MRVEWSVEKHTTGIADFGKGNSDIIINRKWYMNLFFNEVAYVNTTNFYKSVDNGIPNYICYVIQNMCIKIAFFC